VDSQGKILAARKMQGVTVLAKFHPLPQYVNEDIHYMDHYHPLVQKENKLTQQAMENAREIYLRVELGNYQETQPLTPLNGAKIQWQLWKNKVQTKLKGSVECCLILQNLRKDLCTFSKQEQKHLFLG